MENKIFMFAVFLIIFVIAPYGGSTSDVSLDDNLISSPSTLAKEMIRGFNLFPGRSVNVVEDGELAVVGDKKKKLVEKRFKFPGFGVSVDDLGHHAGYYQIQHSHDARYLRFFKNHHV